MGNKHSKPKKNKQKSSTTKSQSQNKDPKQSITPQQQIKKNPNDINNNIDEKEEKIQKYQNPLFDSKIDLLIHGFCRTIENVLKDCNYIYNIPLQIIEICISFYKIKAIINIAIGHCGNEMNKLFFQSLFNEYNNNNNINKSNTYLRQSSPRSILIDLEPVINDNNDDNTIFGKQSAGSNYAKGYYSYGKEIIDIYIDRLRSEIETYDLPQSIQFMHSIGGGTGSGLGTLIIQKTKELYPELMNISFTVFPSPKFSDIVIEPYNTIFSLSGMNEFCDAIFVIDNESLYNISINKYKIKDPQFNDINFISNQMINNVSSLFRYKDSVGFNVSSFINSMIKYPKLNLLTTSKSPFYNQNGEILETEKYDNIFNLTEKLFETSNCYADCSIKGGVNLSTVILYRGFNDNNNEQIVRNIQNKYWTQKLCGFENDIISTSIKNCDSNMSSSVMITNSTSIVSVLRQFTSKFARMYHNHSFLHWYVAEGMDTRDMQAADRTVRNMITKYSDIRNKYELDTTHLQLNNKQRYPIRVDTGPFTD